MNHRNDRNRPFHFGSALQAADHDGNNPYRYYPRPFITGLDEYLAWVRQAIHEKQATDGVSLKLPIASDRGLDFSSVSHGDGQVAGRLSPGQPAGLP